MIFLSVYHRSQVDVAGKHQTAAIESVGMIDRNGSDRANKLLPNNHILYLRTLSKLVATSRRNRCLFFDRNIPLKTQSEC